MEPNIVLCSCLQQKIFPFHRDKVDELVGEGDLRDSTPLMIRKGIRRTAGHHLAMPPESPLPRSARVSRVQKAAL